MTAAHASPQQAPVAPVARPGKPGRPSSSPSATAKRVLITLGVATYLGATAAATVYGSAALYLSLIHI